MQMKYKDMIAQAPLKEVSLGSQGIALFSPAELDENQVGYSIDPTGTDLTGSADGDWRKEWIVIAYDTLLSDPFFIDTTTAEYLVYTAMHGAGTWKPRPVSPSLEAFIHSLSVLQEFEITIDRTQLDQRIERAQTRLAEINGPSHTEFWETLFQALVDEIEEQ
jgi:hypothetical protein